jgi:hypothetical protein
MDQSEGGGVVQNRMTLAYDAVIYNSGAVDVDEPAGFAVLHYDNTPSPIADEETLIGGSEGIFGDLFSMNSFQSPLDYITSLRYGGNSINPYNNLGNQAPYGYNSPNYYGATQYPYSVSGLQNYGFGNSRATNGLVTAGIGIAGNLISNVLKNVFSPGSSRADRYNAEQTGVATPTNPSGSANSATDNGTGTTANGNSPETQARNAEKVANAEATLTKTQNDLAAAQNAEKDATAKFNDSTAKAAEQQKTIDAAQGKIDTAEQTKTEANAEIDRLNSKQAELDGKLANGEITLDQYNRQTQTTNQVKQTYQDQINESDKTIADSQKSINEATVLKSNYQNSADQAFADATDARQQVSQLDQKQISDAKALDEAEQQQTASQTTPPNDVYSNNNSSSGMGAGIAAERSLNESSQFGDNEVGSRGDRGSGDATGSVGDNQQQMQDAAYYDQGNLATQTNDAQVDAASSDQGGGSYSDNGDPGYQGDVVAGYDTPGFV